MYVYTGEKSYLWTDYSAARKYFLVKFEDGNGEQWWQLAYRWGFWTYYLQSLRHSGECGRVGSPLAFDCPATARQHLADERDWLERQEKSRQVSTEIVEEMP